ncbi:ATP synthase F1 subunit epsilon [Clostridium sardiniense]|uniref:ATP synthase F1 subunit epsilon n=1 Tax=Clostridium sardiniense TaxID=29369 RepID=UPI003D33F67C
MANTFKLKIMTPDKVKIDEEVLSLTTKTSEGKFEILANHASIVVNTVPCVTEVTKANGEKIQVATSVGIIGFKNNELNFCCRSAETKEELDSGRAEEAKQRAEKRLSDEKFDQERAKAALDRALARLELKK